MRWKWTVPRTYCQYHVFVTFWLNKRFMPLVLQRWLLYPGKKSLFRWFRRHNQASRGTSRTNFVFCDGVLRVLYHSFISTSTAVSAIGIATEKADAGISSARILSCRYATAFNWERLVVAVRECPQRTDVVADFLLGNSLKRQRNMAIGPQQPTWPRGYGHWAQNDVPNRPIAM